MTGWCSPWCAGGMLRAPIDIMKAEGEPRLERARVAACRLLTVARDRTSWGGAGRSERPLPGISGVARKRELGLIE